MKFRTRTSETPEIGLTPLIDVVFLLVIFFMVSTTFRKEAELQIDLPQASQEPLRAEQRSLEILIDEAGTYVVNNRILTDNRPQTLRAALQLLAGEERKLPLLIRADAQATHQAVVTAMDVASKLGFNRMSIATEQPQKSNN